MSHLLPHGAGGCAGILMFVCVCVCVFELKCAYQQQVDESVSGKAESKTEIVCACPTLRYPTIMLLISNNTMFGWSFVLLSLYYARSHTLPTPLMPHFTCDSFSLLSVTCWICCRAWRGFTSQRCLRLINQTSEERTSPPLSFPLGLSAAVDKLGLPIESRRTDWMLDRLIDWRRSGRTGRLTGEGIDALTEPRGSTVRIVCCRKSNWSLNWSWNWRRQHRVLKASCAVPSMGDPIKYPASWVIRRYVVYSQRTLPLWG